MKKSISALLLLFSFIAFGQLKDNQWIRAFPITDYMVDINDSTKLVQIQLPANIIIKEKQLGLLRSTFSENAKDDLEIGAGKCYLIKGNFIISQSITKKAINCQKQEIYFIQL